MTNILVTKTKPLLMKIDGPIYIEDAISMRTKLHGLISQGHIHFLVDMSSVNYIDCCGLGVLVGIKNKVSANGGDLVVTGISGLVEDMFNLTKLQDYLCYDQTPAL